MANHKNYMLKEDTVDFVKNISNSGFNSKCNLIICPSFIYFPYYENKGISLGMQDFDILKSLNGGISVNQMKSLGVKYCIVGHSDNRINKN